MQRTNFERTFFSFCRLSELPPFCCTAAFERAIFPSLFLWSSILPSPSLHKTYSLRNDPTTANLHPHTLGRSQITLTPQQMNHHLLKYNSRSQKSKIQHIHGVLPLPFHAPSYSSTRILHRVVQASAKVPRIRIGTYGYEDPLIR